MKTFILVILIVTSFASCVGVTRHKDIKNDTTPDFLIDSATGTRLGGHITDSTLGDTANLDSVKK